MSIQRKCIRRSQGWMAAPVIFHHRCEATQVKSPSARATTKAVSPWRFSAAIFRITSSAGNAGTRHIPAGLRERFVREGIDMVIRNWHAQQNITWQKPLAGRLVGKPEVIRSPQFNFWFTRYSAGIGNVHGQAQVRIGVVSLISWQRK